VRIAIVLKADTREEIEVAAMATQMLDQLVLRDWLASGHQLASLADLGIYYEPEPRCEGDLDDRDTCAEERFLTLPEMLDNLKRGRGSDCDDIAPAHAALLVVTGRDEQARAHVLEVGPRSWHVVVKRGDGSIDDPCRALGMGSQELEELHRPPHVHGVRRKRRVA